MSKGLTVKKAKVKEAAEEFEAIEQIFEPKCQNKTFECTLLPEEGQQYCIKHILQVPGAPYKQCSYIYSNGKLCTQARPSDDRNDSK